MYYLINPFKNIFNYSGRSSRKEFWMFQLSYIILFILLIFPLSFLGLFLGTNIDILTDIYVFGFLFLHVIINISISVRRIHDLNKSGSYLFYSLVPLVGHIIVLIALTSEGDKGRNFYGEDPRDIKIKQQNIENF